MKRNYKKKICIICGKSYEAYNNKCRGSRFKSARANKSKTCSHKCSQKNYDNECKKSHKKFLKDNPNYWKDYKKIKIEKEKK